MHIVVLTPVLDDWVAARQLLSLLDSAFASTAGTLTILLVDDGSTETPPHDFGAGPFTRLQEVSVLKLKKNLGNQRAIAVGLCHIAEKIPCDAVVVMDSDGEDDPHDAVRLADKLREFSGRENEVPPIVFAERTQRSESFIFRLGYLGYRILHYVLTGRGIRFGNFSIIPRARLIGLTVEPMIWNHYAASVVGGRLPFATIPSRRASRLDGKSRQGFVRLVIHGLSALSCYNDIIGVRLLLFSSLLLGFSVLGIIAILALSIFTHFPLPDWTAVLAGIFIVFLFQVITLATNFTMQIISARSVQPFLPARDYTWYIDRVDKYPRA